MLDKIFPKIHTEGYKFLVIFVAATIVLYFIHGFLGFVGLAIPDFMIALIAMYLFFVWFDFSPGGLFSPEYVGVPWSWGRVKDLIDHIWIPMVVLGTAGTASLMRITRANLLDELSKPYVITARAKGLSEWRLIFLTSLLGWYVLFIK